MGRKWAVGKEVKIRGGEEVKRERGLRIRKHTWATAHCQPVIPTPQHKSKKAVLTGEAR